MSPPDRPSFWELANGIMGLIWLYYEMRRSKRFVNELYAYANRKAYSKK